MIKFYFQYDKDRHKAKFVVIEEGGSQDVYYVDKIYCHVEIESVSSEYTPRFVVAGNCDKWTLENADNFSTLTIK